MKIVIKIAFVILIVLTLVILWFYFYLRVNSIDVSNESPFKEVIGKTLELERDVYIIREKTSDFYKQPSKLVELDGLGMIDKEKYTTQLITKGTKLVVNSATIRSHGESGTYPQIIGVLHTEKFEIPFTQRWGRCTFNMLLGNEEPKKGKTSFVFEKPIWITQTEYTPTDFYFLPEL